MEKSRPVLTLVLSIFSTSAPHYSPLSRSLEQASATNENLVHRMVTVEPALSRPFSQLRHSPSRLLRSLFRCSAARAQDPKREPARPFRHGFAASAQSDPNRDPVHRLPLPPSPLRCLLSSLRSPIFFRPICH